MLNKLERQEKGFTIIEVMIVLAIAGLILLIVFLAVPALQRNSRNTQRKNDVGNLNAAVNEFISNHQGKLPLATGTPATATFDGGVISNIKPGYYDVSNISYATTMPGTAPTSATADAADKVFVYGGTKCNDTGDGIVQGTLRQAATLYFIETSSSTVPQCQDV